MKPLYKAHIALKGQFDIEIRHADGTSSFYGAIPNMVVNQGLDALGGVIPSGMSSISSIIGGVAVGTGNATPSASDTHLSIFLAGTTSAGAINVTSNNTAPWSNTESIPYTFPLGGVIGNIAELGALIGAVSGAPSSTSPISTRALIMVGGSPGTITVTATDQLIVTYSMQWIYTAQGSGSVNVTTDGTPVSVTWQVMPQTLGNSSTNYTAAPIAVLPSPSNGGAASNTSFVASTAAPTQVRTFDTNVAGTYTTGSFTRTWTFHFNATSAVSRVMYYFGFTCMRWQMLFNTAFGPSATQTMDFPIQLTWANAS